MKKETKWLIIWLAVAYVILATGRALYLMNTPEKAVSQDKNFAGPQISSTASVRNYAKVMFKTPAGLMQIGQTYEKSAQVYNGTNDFDNYEKTLRETVKKEEALIQKEEVSGMKGARTIEMAIGVYPEKFDSVVEQLKRLGDNRHFRVTKTDKTAEYRKLRAEKAALEERKKSLLQLKSRNGKIEELIALENKIYDIVKEIHGLDLSIGEFEGVKDFCTIYFTLLETGTKPDKNAFIWNAMDWAFWKLLVIVIIALIASMAVTFAVKVWASIKTPAVASTEPAQSVSKNDTPVEQAESIKKNKRK
jgi:hypothetical protein